MGYRIAELVELGITAKMLGDAGIEAAREVATGDPEVGERVAVDARKAELPTSLYGRPLGVVLRVNAKSYTVRLVCDGREVYAQRDAIDRCAARSSASQLAQAELVARARIERDAAQDNAEAAVELDAGAEPLVVIPCGGAKLDRPALAGELYTGSYHAACRRAAEVLTSPDRIRILSARYGLLRLDDPVEPYELRMGQPGSVAVDTVRRQAAAQELVDEAEVVVLAGAAYADVALQVWPHARRPLDGSRGIGDQLARMVAMRASSSRRDTLDLGGHDGPPNDQEVNPVAHMTVSTPELQPGDLLLPERATVVEVELPQAPAVVAKIVTRGAPIYAGIAARHSVERAELVKVCATCGRPVRQADGLHAGGWRHDDETPNAHAEWCETADGYVRVEVAR